MTRGKGASLDIHRLHLWMWSTRTREGYLSAGQAELAAKLGVAQFSVNRYLRWMTTAGRLKKLAQGKYIVIDPERYLWEKNLGPGKRNQQDRPWKMRTDNRRENRPGYVAPGDGPGEMAEIDHSGSGMSELQTEDPGL